jgi:hypothetical protein
MWMLLLLLLLRRRRRLTVYLYEYNPPLSQFLYALYTIHHTPHALNQRYTPPIITRLTIHDKPACSFDSLHNIACNGTAAAYVQSRRQGNCHRRTLGRWNAELALSLNALYGDRDGGYIELTIWV